MRISRISAFACFTIVSTTFSFSAQADTSHFKEILIGDRGAGMAGAYSAVADDASGAYYNPAGLAFGSTDAMTGISNATNFVWNRYEGAVQEEHEVMEGWRYLITYIAYMKRFGDSIVGLSYVIDDSTEVHQEQTFDNGLIVNQRGDDRTYQYGPSWAYQIGPDLSVGTTLYVFQREYYNMESRLLFGSDGNETWRYRYNEGSEFGGRITAGMMWSPTEPIALGLVLKNTLFTHKEDSTHTSIKPAASSDVIKISTSNNELRTMPFEITLGLAWFVSPYLLWAIDVDHYAISVENKMDVTNISTGVEYFINEKNVLRGGLYTNFDNDTEPDSTTTGHEKVDCFGFALSYSIFNGPTMITAGAVLSTGYGKSQIDPDNPSDIKEMTRETWSFSLAVSYNVD
ncbi:MAG: hypothetical protein GY866_19435 [Proteobacteria bacterium]|nr:hypothetical protein [Pseudomonadota bacterium]